MKLLHRWQFQISFLISSDILSLCKQKERKHPLSRAQHYTQKVFYIVLSVLYLRLQPSHDLLPSLHDRVQFARDHDGEALVFGQRQLDVGSRPLHDVQAHFGLLALPELAVVLVATLLQGHMEHLGRGKRRGEVQISGESHLIIFPEQVELIELLYRHQNGLGAKMLLLF